MNFEQRSKEELVERLKLLEGGRTMSRAADGSEAQQKLLTS